MTPSGPGAAESWATASAPGWGHSSPGESSDLLDPGVSQPPRYDDETAQTWQPAGADPATSATAADVDYDDAGYQDADYDDEHGWDYDLAPAGLPGGRII